MADFINHGALPGRKPSDYAVVAGVGALPFEIVNLTGAWEDDVPTNEPQYDPAGYGKDRFNCVTQASHNQKENIMMFDIRTGRMPKEHEQWLRDNGYFDDNGKLNFSERFNSVLNGTIANWGNYVYAVLDHDRNVGLIPARMLPDIPGMPTSEYYNPAVLTPAMYAMAAEFKKRFYLPWEWIGTVLADIQKHLKQAPLLVTIPGHEVVEIRNLNDLMRINDSYPAYVKDMPQANVTDVAKQLVQYIINNTPMDKTVVFAKRGTPLRAVLQEENWMGFADPESYEKHVAGTQVVLLWLDAAEFDKLVIKDVIKK